MITNPVGIDLPIQEMQQLFIDNLWTDVDVSKKQFNHRVFNNEKDGISYPALFVESIKDYSNVVFDDRLTVLSWFDVSPTTNSFNGSQITQDVGVFFAVNLKELYPTLTHRTVEEAHRDAKNVIIQRAITWAFDSIITGDGAYGDFDSSNLKGFDMQPWHVFRINCNVSFTLNCK